MAGPEQFNASDAYIIEYLLDGMEGFGERLSSDYDEAFPADRAIGSQEYLEGLLEALGAEIDREGLTPATLSEMRLGAALRQAGNIGDAIEVGTAISTGSRYDFVVESGGWVASAGAALATARATATLGAEIGELLAPGKIEPAFEVVFGAIGCVSGFVFGNHAEAYAEDLLEKARPIDDFIDALEAPYTYENLAAGVAPDVRRIMEMSNRPEPWIDQYPDPWIN
ncbi:MAG: hypothetical protein AAGA70_16405 [Pseudomonadota bacterium]